jgi:uncharacterized membrane-anchored protein YitT (DUF2179 family)
MKNNVVFKTIWEHLAIAFGLLCYAWGWQFFLNPHEVVGGAVTGLATVIMYGTRGLLPESIQGFFDMLGMASQGGGIPVSFTFFLINGILLIMSIRIFGWQFSLRSIFGVIMLTIWLWIPFPELYIKAFGTAFPKFDIFPSVIMAGILTGFGLALTFVNNGSSGGTDIVAKIINKYKDVSLGRALMLSDVAIIFSAILLPESTLEKVIYGLIVMVISTQTVDMYINSLRQSVQFFIFSKKYEEIGQAINTELNRGVTLLDAKGFYTKEQIQVMTVIARKNQSPDLFNIIKRIDPEAFISQTQTIGVYGRGFEVIGTK